MKLPVQKTAHIYGWLFLLPAAVLMVAFTPSPVVAGNFASFYSTPKAGRLQRFVGLENYSSMIAVANIWLFFYTPQIGLLDQIGSLFGMTSHTWLGDTQPALGCMMVLAVWKDAGFFMIFFLAAL
ncbi:MAG: hypothetical protein Q8M56_01665, partial [Desulfobacterales bacterium]|nr:hypothetical protein [Desulfobacterales bacterium]